MEFVGIKITKQKWLVFFLLFAAVFFALPGKRAEAEISLANEAQITNDGNIQSDPAIYGNRIVWQDNRNGNYDIYMYDTSTLTETQITDESADQTGSQIYGNIIVWEDERNGNYDIYMYNINTSTETQITNNSADQLTPKIYGNVIVWVDDRNGNYDIYMYDISNSIETQITDEETEQNSPAIYGDKIVWASELENSDIYMYDISDSTESKITSDASFYKWGVDMYDNIIVWNDTGTIYMYDLLTSTETEIGSTNKGYYTTTIYGDKIAWSSNIYDITKQEVYSVSNGINPAVYNGNIVWGSGSNNYDIYLATIDYVPATPTANPDAGTYSEAQLVELSSDEDSDFIMYDTAEMPADCESGTLYESAIEVATSTTIYARACDNDGNSATASFEYTIEEPPVNYYTLTYTAGANGTISGDTPQTVEEGTDGTPVEAIPDSGYVFDCWDDAICDNPRIDTAVGGDIFVTASFVEETLVVPTIEFTSTSSSIGEGDGTANVEVSLSEAASEDVTVDYAVTGGNATGGGNDYSLASGTATILAGDIASSIIVDLTDDNLDEENETVEITLSNPTNATLGTNTIHTLTIEDNDEKPTVEFSSSSGSFNENDGDRGIEIWLSEYYSVDVLVDYEVTGGTATGGGVDYTLASGTATIPAGWMMGVYVPITIIDDTLVEGNETVEITLSNPINATLGTNTTYTLTILDDDEEIILPTVEFSSATTSFDEDEEIPEGNLPSSTPNYDSTISGDDNQFYFPLSVATDSQDNTYVTDAGSIMDVEVARIQKFSSDETYLASIGSYGTDDGQFIFPVGVAIDSDDNIYVTDVATYRIQKFDSSGTFLAKWGSQGTGNGQFGENDMPMFGITIDSFDNVYVTDPGNSRIQKFDSSGTYLSSFGSSGTGDGQFGGMLTGLIIDDQDNVYVSDVENGRIQKFNSSGTYDSSFGSFGTNDGQFQGTITDVAVDSVNNVYVTETGVEEISRIQKFAADGDFLAKWGTPGTGNENFMMPYGMAIDSSDNIYVADTMNNRVQKFSYSEDDEYLTNARFEISRSSVSDSDTTVDYAVTGGTAIGEGVDYTLASGTATIPVGQTSAIIQYSIIDDLIHEDDETIQISLSNPENATLGTNDEQTVTIIDNDEESETLTVEFTETTSSGSEDSLDSSYTPIFIPVSLSSPSEYSVEVDCEVTGGTAINYADYVMGSLGCEVFFEAGETSGDIAVIIINDEINEEDETIEITLVGDPWNANLGTNIVHTFTIIDDDDDPKIGFSSALASFNENAENLTGRIPESVPDYVDTLQPEAPSVIFEYPDNIAVDSLGNIYVSDNYTYSSDDSIKKISPEGELITEWGTEGGIGDGQFGDVIDGYDENFDDGPGNIAIDSLNNIYVVDRVNYRIQKFDSGGTFLLKWGSEGSGDGQFQSIVDIAVDSLNNVYVVDSTDDIQKFDSSGNFIAKWDNSSYYPTVSIAGVNSITTDSSNNVYITERYDTGDNTPRIRSYILKFDSNGNFLTDFDFETSDGISNIQVDSLGNIYVKHYYEIQKFDSSGNFVGEWGSSGIGYGQFRGITDIEIDSSGNVYVSDAGNNCIHKFNSDGDFLAEFGSDNRLNFPRDFAFDSLGNIYVANSDNGRIEKFDSDGNFVDRWGGRTNLGYYDEEDEMPVAVAVDSHDDIYEVDDGASCVRKYDSDGNLLFLIGDEGNDGDEDSEFDNPTDIMIDSSDNIYVVDSGNSRIQKFDSDGTFLLKWGSEGMGEGEFSSPLHIIKDSHGDIYVADYNIAGTDYVIRLQKFNSDGEYISQFSLSSFGSGNGESFFIFYYAIAIDSSDNIYLADSFNNRIEKFDLNGNFLAKWGLYGSENGQFILPLGIKTDPSNNIWVSTAGNLAEGSQDNWENGKIQKFFYSEDFNYTTNANFELSLDGTSTEDVTVDYTVTGGTATGTGDDADYTLASGTATIPAGETSIVVEYSIIDDLIHEDDETIIIGLSEPTNATLGTNDEQTVTIVDNEEESEEPTVQFTSTSSSNLENVTSTNIEVSLSESSVSDVTVNYTVNGTATGGGVDYTLANGTLTIPSGSTTANIPLTIINDDDDESNETVIVTLSSPSGATLGTNTVHTYTITDDDEEEPEEPTIQFTSAASSDSESVTSTNIGLSLSEILESDVTVDYAVTNGSATENIDYILEAGTATIPAGSTTTNIPLTIIDDSLDEDNETIIITLSNPTNVDLGTNTSHTYTIIDNDDEEDEPEDLKITDVEYSSTQTEINITWKTNRDANSTVFYGLDKNLKEKEENNKREKKHEMTLTNLTPDTKYYFRIKSKDKDGISDRTKIYSIFTKPEICTSFTYSDWGECQPNNTQTRTITERLPKNCTGGTPEELTRDCIHILPPITCTSFIYSDWGECQSNNTQSRSITSQLPPDCTGGNPENLIQACLNNEEEPIIPEEERKEEITNEIKETITKFTKLPTVEIATLSSIITGILATATLPLAASTSTSTGIALAGNMLKALFGKRSKKQWGLVFDSKTKTPIDFATVAIYNNNGNLVDKTLTDKDGRFGFLALAGSYQLKVFKDKFIFPSKLSGGEPDDIYGKTYNGEIIQITEDQVLKLNIPVDAQFDLMQLAGQRIKRFTSIGGIIGKFALNAMFVIGFLLAIFTQIFNPSNLNLIFLAIYSIFVIHQIFFKKKNFGLLIDSQTKQPIPFARINIFKDDFSNAKVDFALTDMYGRFFKLLENGYYLLDIKGTTLSQRLLSQKRNIRVNKGILNEKIRM